MVMLSDETIYAMALTRISNFNFSTALALYNELGSATAIYEHRNDIADVVDGCSSRLIAALKDWSEPLKRAEMEMNFAEKHGIKVLTLADDDYPQRMRECQDAPLVMYYKGSSDLNRKRIISIVGTRKCTNYGKDIIRRMMKDMKELCPDVLVVSGLAYGIDINAHREALVCGYDTVGVLAHGLDQLYPSSHRETAKTMLQHGGLLTEYMSATNADKVNFVRRNRIVAGMTDATIVIESAAKGGSLITADIARNYGRDVFAFPGNVGTESSTGCNNLIRDNIAALVTSAEDIINAMGWQDDAVLQHAKAEGIERSLFPDLTPEEQMIVDVLQKTNDLQINILAVKANMPIHRLTALLFQLEMKGVVKPLAGGMYHLMT